MSDSKPRYVGDVACLDAVLARLSARPGDGDAARRSDCYRRVCGLLGQAYDAPPDAREAIIEAAKLQLIRLHAAYETARLLIEEAELDLLYAGMDLTVPPDPDPDPDPES